MYRQWCSLRQPFSQRLLLCRRRRPPTPHRNLHLYPPLLSSPSPQTPPQPRLSSLAAVSSALRDVAPTENSLLAPVHIPSDPHGVLGPAHPAASILSHSAIVVQRQLEMMNVMIGFEEANRYAIMDPRGAHLGFMAERELGTGNMLARQFFRTSRAFTTHVFDRGGREVLRFDRPFSWLLSRIRVYDPIEPGKAACTPSTELQTVGMGTLSASLDRRQMRPSQLALSDMRVVGEAQQQWAALRQKYNLFLVRGQPPGGRQEHGRVSAAPEPDPAPSYRQFAHIDERFLSWDYSLLDSAQRRLGSVTRNFTSLGREVFTDTGVYALRMDAVGLAEGPSRLVSQPGSKESAHKDVEGGGMSLDQRAVMLATAVSVDFDHFSYAEAGGVFWDPLLYD